MSSILAQRWKENSPKAEDGIPRLNPHPVQKQILAEMARYNVVACGRRIGKTELAKDRLLEPALKGFPVAYFCPTYKMLTPVWKALVNLCAPITASKSEQEHSITLTTGGVIDCWSLDSADSTRGRKYKRAIIDEAAMVPNLENAWTAVIRPTLTDYAGDADFYSTPKGFNYFHQLWSLGQDPLKPNWKSWKFPTRMNPTLPEGEVDEAREMLPASIFSQEYEAEFIDDASAVFRGVIAAATAKEQEQREKHHTYVIGVDLARQNDFSVFSVIDATTHELVVLDRFNHVEYMFQADRLLALCEKFCPKKVIVEENSNLAFGEYLYRIKYCDSSRNNEIVHLPLELFKTTNASKSEIIQSLSLAFEQKQIQILNEPVLVNELQAFAAERLPSGMFRYGAPEGMHDDCVISLALAWREALYYLGKSTFHSVDEKIETMIPEKHRLENISQLPDPESEAVTMGRYYAVATARHELEKKAAESMGFRQRGKFKHSTRRRF
jgi:hypothetical protein